MTKRKKSDEKRVAEYIATKPRSDYQLLAPNAEGLALALKAWRSALLYHRRVLIEHAVDRAQYRKLDEFDPVAVFRENESFYAERLLEAARQALVRAAVGERPYPLDPYDAEMFAPERFAARFGSDTAPLRVWGDIAAAREALSSLPGDERGIAALTAATNRKL